MTLNGQNALCRRKDASFGAHCSNLNEDRVIDPYYQRQKCRPMILVSGNIRFIGIFMGFLLVGASNKSGVDDDGNFWPFEWLLLRNLQR